MLTSWAADGSLGAAAREALGLDGEPAQLTALISQWAAGDFSGLPPIEVVEGSVLPGAAGAYAIRETLENPGNLRDNGSVIAGQDWGNGRQAAWLLGLRADDGEEADQTGEVSL